MNTSARSYLPGRRVIAQTLALISVLSAFLLFGALAAIPARSQRSPTLTPVFDKIAFTSKRDGHAQIYLMNPDGSNQFNISQNTFNESQPAWSPDGTQLTFVSDRDGNSEICVMNTDGNNQHCLTNEATADKKPNPKLPQDYEPTWSSDGQRIAFVSTRSGSPDIWAMNADGSNPLDLTQSVGNNDQPAWSPDLKSIVFVSDRDGNSEICVMDASGFNQRCLTNEGTRTKKPDKTRPMDSHPVWSPDSQRIAFVSTRERNRNRQVFVMNADGSNPINVIKKISSDDQPSWGPDGQSLVFTSNRDGLLVDIYVTSLNGNTQTRLTHTTRGGDFNPVYAPPLPAVSTTPTQTLTTTPTGTIIFTQIPSETPTRAAIVFAPTFTLTPSLTNTNPPAPTSPPPPPPTKVPPSSTPSKTLPPTATFTSSLSPIPSNTPTPTNTFTPSHTPTATFTFTPSHTPTHTPTATNTPLPCNFVGSQYTVTNLSDGAGAGPVGSLRLGITCANTFPTPTKSVVFQIGLAGTITLSGGALTLTASMNIFPAAGSIGLPVTISANSNSSVFIVNSSVSNAFIGNLTITKGNNTNGGGGIANSGTLFLNNCEVTNSGSFNPGGDILNTGTLTIRSSTIVGGIATGAGGDIDNKGTLTMTNSTVFGGSSTGGAGGLENEPGAHATLNFVTVAGNTSQFLGAVDSQPTATTTLVGTLIGGNTTNSAFGSSDVSGTFSAQNYNLVQSVSGANGFGGSDITGVSPNLEAFGNYGGPTRTVMIPAGSPAVDKVPFGNICSMALGVDQRNVPRPQSASCDIGAVERKTTDPGPPPPKLK
ncbi:MAG: choice-of-anchor Q domain-containing protein [Aggregatilineales bacterium]